MLEMVKFQSIWVSFFNRGQKMDIPRNLPIDELEKTDVEMHLLGKEITDTPEKYDLKSGRPVKTQEELDKISQYLSTGRFQKIPIKTPEEIAKLKISGGICAKILDEISPHVKPGATKKQLNEMINQLISVKYLAEVDRLMTDAQTDASSRISACFGLNDIIVNAAPDDEPLKTGDLFGIDISIRKNGWCGDTRKSWLIGEEASPVTMSLFAASHEAMWLAISLVKHGARVEMIANAVETYAKQRGFSMLKLPITAGHSLGSMHMDGWLIPLYDTPINKGRVLEKGMVITIETFMSAGSGEAYILNDECGSAVTKDGAVACYWEHAVAVTENGCEILDLRAGEKEYHRSV